MKRERLATALPFFAFASGSCALIYESLWLRSFGLIFGNTTHAVAAILAVFMGGLALGSFLTGRLYFKRTMRMYALVECGIGASALLTLPLLHYLPAWYGAFVRAHDLSPAAELAFRLVGATFALLPPTALLGMTFPLLIEYLTRRDRKFYRNLGFLYRTNTLGGAFGVFLATFILMPFLGKLATFILAAVTNLTIGLLAWFWTRELREDSKERVEKKSQSKARQGTSPGRAAGLPSASEEHSPAIFLVTAFTTGLFSFGLEVLWTRSLALVIGSSIYSFNIMLITLLIGIVAGTVSYEACWERIRKPILWLALLILAVGVLCLADLALIGTLPVLSFALIKALPVSFPLHVGSDFLLCFLTMFLVTMPLGFLFPLLAHLMKPTQLSPQKISSYLYVGNLSGTIVGSFGTAFVLVPRYGLQTSFVLLAALPLVLGLWFLGRSLHWTGIIRASVLAGGVLVCLALVRWYQPWNLHTMSAGIYKYGVDWRDSLQSAWDLPEFQESGRQILFYREGNEGVVCVNQTGGERTISVNGKGDGGNGQDVITQRLIAHVPLMLHPNPRKVLVIGWGTGSTAGSAGLYPSVNQIDCVEIESLMFTCRSFFTDINHNIASDPRFRIHIKDGRNYLLTTPTLYDAILSEPSNPWITGVSNLFTHDYYAIARNRLNEDGIFCQWFQYYNLTLKDVKVQTRNFAESFPYTSMWLVPPKPVEVGSPILFGDLLFIGSAKPHRLDYERVRQLYENKAIRDDLIPLGGVDDELAFLSNYFMNRSDMLRFGQGTPENSDDFPYLEFSAPKGMYQGQADAQKSIIEIYRNFDEGGSELLPPIDNYPPLLHESSGASRHADLYVAMGSHYRKKAFLSRARRLAETAIREDSRNAGAYALLGEVLYDQGLVDEAANLFVQALGLSPKLQRACRILGAIYYSRKEFGKAEQVYIQLAQNFPDDPYGYLGQAAIFAERHNWSRAREFVDKTLSIDPKIEDAIKLRDYLKQR
jgi:spermidine synthase